MSLPRLAAWQRPSFGLALLFAPFIVALFVDGNEGDRLFPELDHDASNKIQI
jgi:hypothetical protein